MMNILKRLARRMRNRASRLRQTVNKDKKKFHYFRPALMTWELAAQMLDDEMEAISANSRRNHG